jgi:hypothetical protein
VTNDRVVARALLDEAGGEIRHVNAGDTARREPVANM